MSSHHIVRDDQEPALIITNGASCSEEELIGQLLEWSPFSDCLRFGYRACFRIRNKSRCSLRRF